MDMSKSIKAVFSLLRCPVCGKKFSFDDVAHQKNRARFTLHCDECHFDYCVKDNIPSLLPPHLAAIVSQFRNLSNGARVQLNTPDLTNAHKWLSETLQILPGRLPKDSSLLSRVASLLNLCSQSGFSFEDTCEIIGMWASSAISSHYRKSVADQMYGSIEAISYERYEDIILRLLINNLLRTDQVALIEIGSGVGRILHQYGSCISTREDAARRYRLNFPLMYGPNSLDNPHNLKLIIGLDFQEKMLSIATGWLKEKESRLYALVREGRIVQIRGSVRYMPLSLGDPKYDDVYKVVCILFQTLGNQLCRELQIEMLRRAWQLTFPKGLLLVSVFSRKVFHTQAMPYYSSIKKSVGKGTYLESGAFLSSKGVYSRWFEEEELSKLFIDANIKDFRTFNGHNLKDFPDFQGYIDLESQNEYKKRALIGIGGTPSQLESISKRLSA